MGFGDFSGYTRSNTGELQPPAKAKVVAIVKKTKKQKARDAKATHGYVNRAINRALNRSIDTYYSDGLTLSASTTQQYLDLTASLWTLKGISGISLENRFLQFRGVCNMIDSINHVRFIIFKWKPDTASYTPGSNDVIRNDASGSTPWGLRHYEKRKQVQILYDRMFAGQFQTTGSTMPPSIHFDIRLSAKQLGESQFNQGLNTGTNHIFFMYCSDSNIASHPNIYGNLTMRYIADDS